ncbi:glycosyltransferase family 4 protein [Pontibacter ummariensis]|uniref:glycosyltransferase family 4 protein n=1 Tax=Pontibacter ummariensis TaxID=1610492 RepID=UPI0015C58B2D|nr:glycosyltransferase family 1 protein [Pontibacter ummariensis]
MSKIKLFLRPQRRGAYSVENLFQTLYPYMKEEAELYTLQGESKGWLGRMKMLQEVRCNKSLNVNHITGEVNFIALALPKNNTVLTIHDVESLHRSNFWATYLLRLLWLKLPVQRVKFITVVSEQTKQRLLEQVAVDPFKIEVIPNPVSEAYTYSPKPFNTIQPNILQIGTKKNKNLANIIKAVAGLPCKLTIIGELSESQRNLLQKYHVPFENKAALTKEQLVEEYRRADIVSFVSTFEGFGMPIVEANAVGRVVLTSNISSMPEVAGDAAFLVDPYDVKDIRRGFERLLQDEQLRSRLIQNGLENVKRYRPQEIAGKYLQLYRRIE